MLYNHVIEESDVVDNMTNLNSKHDCVIKYIKDLIDSHIYSQGQIIDSESKLCETLNVSRMTVRKALDKLVSDGVIYKEKGRGTFVSKKPKYAEFRLGAGGFTQEVTKRGLLPSTKDATLELVEADDYISHNLNIPIGEKVWKVTRVRCADDLPIIYVVEYFIYSQCPDLSLEIVYNSIYEHLEKKGIIYAFLDQKLEAVACPQIIADKLNVEKGHPVIKMSLIIYMKNGIAYNCGTEYYLSDKYTLIQSVYRNE